MFLEGVRLREYSSKDLLPLSGKLLPEFDTSKRRSIRDMFSKPLSETAGSRPATTDVRAQASVDQFRDLPFSNAAHSFESHEVSEGNKKQTSSSTERQVAAPFRGVKRELSGRTLAVNASKKTKSASSAVQAAPLKAGQRSLKGFFKPKISKNADLDHEVSQPSQESTEDSTRYCESVAGTQESLASDTIASNTAEESTPRISQEDTGEKGKLLQSIGKTGQDRASEDSEIHPARRLDQSPSKSVESWSKLFAKPLAPRCEGHDEPCKTMVTKKPGVNCGRSFWMCAKPLGPSGMKETGTAWRCKTFIWCKDWNSNGQQ